MKYSLKRHLLVEATQPLDAFQEMLATSVTSSSFDGYADTFILQQGECLVILEIHIDDFEQGNKVWVNSVHTTDSQGKPSEGCYRKGYAAQMMSRLTRAADQHGITLELIAAPPPHLKRSLPSLPDKDELAKFYAKHGFLETKRNMAQVYMRREPQSSKPSHHFAINNRGQQ